MQKSFEYIKNVSVVLLAALALFVAAGAISVVLNATTWETLGDWSLKALIVAAILLAGNLIVAFLLGAVSKNGQK